MRESSAPLQDWIPAFAGMTIIFAGMTIIFAGMTIIFAGMTIIFAGMTTIFAGMTTIGNNPNSSWDHLFGKSPYLPDPDRLG
jgi:uncharacterized membrane protein